MVTYLEDGVKITSKIIELLHLVYSAENGNLSSTARKLKINKGVLHRIFKEEEECRQEDRRKNEKRCKQIHEYQVQKAVDYLKKQGQTEEGLCQLLNIDGLEKIFTAPKISQSLIFEKAEEYIRKQEISRAEFFRQLKSEYPDSVKIVKNSFHDLFSSRTQVAHPELLATIKLFLDKKNVDRIQEPPKADYERVMRMAEQYLKKKKITPYAMANLLRQYDLSIGSPIAIQDWLKRRRKPGHPRKLRIIKSYLEKINALSRVKPSANIDQVLYRLNPKISLEEIAVRTDLTDTLPKEYSKKLTAQMEQEIINYHQRNGKHDLVPLVLSTMFGRQVCCTLADFASYFPALAGYLKKNDGRVLAKVFEQALSSMDHEEILQVADNYRPPTDILPHLGVLAEELKSRIDGLKNYLSNVGNDRKIEGADKNEIIPEEEDLCLDEEPTKMDALSKLTQSIKIRRIRLEYEIMQKLQSDYKLPFEKAFFLKYHQMPRPKDKL